MTSTRRRPGFMNRLRMTARPRFPVRARAPARNTRAPRTRRPPEVTTNAHARPADPHPARPGGGAQLRQQARVRRRDCGRAGGVAGPSTGGWTAPRRIGVVSASIAAPRMDLDAVVARGR